MLTPCGNVQEGAERVWVIMSRERVCHHRDRECAGIRVASGAWGSGNAPEAGPCSHPAGSFKRGRSVCVCHYSDNSACIWWVILFLRLHLSTRPRLRKTKMRAPCIHRARKPHCPPKTVREPHRHESARLLSGEKVRGDAHVPGKARCCPRSQRRRAHSPAWGCWRRPCL